MTDAEFEVVGRAADADGLTDLVRAMRPNVAITDIRMPPDGELAGLRAAVAIRRELPDVGVLVLSQHVELRHADELLSSGGPEIVSLLLRRRRVRDPLEALTPRERSALPLMAEGCSNEAIGQQLGVETKTVESNVGSIFAKLGMEPSPEDHRRVLAVLSYLRT